jgi:hypothetical protein
VEVGQGEPAAVSPLPSPLFLQVTFCLRDRNGEQKKAVSLAQCISTCLGTILSLCVLYMHAHRPTECCAPLCVLTH